MPLQKAPCSKFLASDSAISHAPAISATNRAKLRALATCLQLNEQKSFVWKPPQIFTRVVNYLERRLFARFLRAYGPRDVSGEEPLLSVINAY